MNEIEQPKETKLDKIKKEMKAKASDTPENPTSQIIHKLADGMTKMTPQPMDSPTDLIKEQIEKSKFLPGRSPNQVVTAAKNEKDGVELPRLNPLPPIVIDGHEFKRTNVPTLDAITVLMYIVSKVLSNNPRIDSILRQVQFQFPDNSGVFVYPRSVKKQQRKVNKKKRNGRSKK